MKDRLTKAITTVTNSNDAEKNRITAIQSALGEKSGTPTELFNAYVSALEAGIGAIGRATNPEEAILINNGMKLVYKEAVKLSREIDPLLTNDLDRNLNQRIQENKGRLPKDAAQIGIVGVLNRWVPGSDLIKSLRSEVQNEMEQERIRLEAQKQNDAQKEAQQAANTPQPNEVTQGPQPLQPLQPSAPSVQTQLNVARTAESTPAVTQATQPLQPQLNVVPAAASTSAVTQATQPLQPQLNVVPAAAPTPGVTQANQPPQDQQPSGPSVQTQLNVAPAASPTPGVNQANQPPPAQQPVEPTINTPAAAAQATQPQPAQTPVLPTINRPDAAPLAPPPPPDQLPVAPNQPDAPPLVQQQPDAANTPQPAAVTPGQQPQPPQNQGQIAVNRAPEAPGLGQQQPDAAPPAPRLSVVRDFTEFLRSDVYIKSSPEDKAIRCVAVLGGALNAIARTQDEGRALQINNEMKVVFAEYDSILVGNKTGAEKEAAERVINADVSRVLGNSTRGLVGPGLSPDWKNRMLAQWDPVKSEGLKGVRESIAKEAEAAAQAKAEARYNATLGALSSIKPQEDFQSQYNKFSPEIKSDLSAFVKGDNSGIDIDKVSIKLSEYAAQNQPKQFEQLYEACPPEIKDQLLNNTKLQNALGEDLTKGDKRIYDYLKGKGANLAGVDKVVSDNAAADKAIADKAAAAKAQAAEAATKKTIADIVATAKPQAEKTPPDKGIVEAYKDIVDKAVVPVKPTPAPLNPEVKKPEEQPTPQRGTAIDDLKNTSKGFLKFGAAFGAAAGLCFIIPGAQVAIPFLLAAAALTTAVGVTGGTLWGLAKLVDALIVAPIKWVAEKIKAPAQAKGEEIEKERLLNEEQNVKKEKEKSVANNNIGYAKLEGVDKAGEALKKVGVKGSAKVTDSTVQKTATPQKTPQPKIEDTTQKNNAVAQR